MKHPYRRLRRSTTAAVLLLALTQACANHGQAPEPNVAPTDAGAPVDPRQVHLVEHELETCSLCDLYHSTHEFVVLIRVPSGLGSGVVLTESGLIVTNAHVVGDADEVQIERFDGSVSSARVLARDTQQDLALLRTDDASLSWSPPPLERAPARVGSEVYLVGHPVGLGWTVTRGIVSALREDARGRLLQTDAAISPGNSGGPVLDAEGHVLGIVTSKAVGSGVENIAFARPTATLIEFLEAAQVEEIRLR